MQCKISGALVCADCGNTDNLEVSYSVSDEKNFDRNPVVFSGRCPVCENLAEVKGLYPDDIKVIPCIGRPGDEEKRVVETEKQQTISCNNRITGNPRPDIKPASAADPATTQNNPKQPITQNSASPNLH